MAEEYNVVPVTIQNISDVKVPAERIATTSTNIYNLLNGKDYKDNLAKVLKSSQLTNTRLDNVKTLLSGIQESVSKVASYTEKVQSSSKSISNTSTDEENYKKETKNFFDKLLESNQRILEEIKGLRKELPDIELHSVSEDSSEDTQKELEGERKEELHRKESLNKTDTMIRLLQDIAASQSKSQANASSALTQGSGGNRGVRGFNGSSDNDGFSIDDVVKSGRNKSQRVSYDNALNALGTQSSMQSKLLSELGDIGKQFLNVFKKSVSDIFNKWDAQTRFLKEQGMGSSNAVQLNRMTKRTMDATEDLLGYNVSVDKAIKATNDMLAAGMNPRYVRENNKQFITGLEAVGIQLAPSTIREIGNSVYDASTVKQLTGEWAALTSPDTENALEKGFVSRQLGSDQYKQMLATIMRTGEYTRADIEKEMQAALRTSISAGFDNETAWKIATLQTQARLGGGAFTVVPNEVQSLIGAAQMSGTYRDLSNIADSLKETTQLYHSDVDIRRRINQASPSLALGGDYTLFNNIQMNDAHTRYIATAEDIRAGQYEGFIPRIGKAVAGILPAESIGGMSQSLTGDTTLFTQMGGNLLGKLGSFAGDSIQTGLLAKIAMNTSKSATDSGGLLQGLFGGTKPSGGGLPSGGALGKIGGLGGVVAILGGIATTAGLMYNANEEQKSAEQQKEVLQKQLNESILQEKSLKDQLKEAYLSGDTNRVMEINRVLNETSSKSDQIADMLGEAKDQKTSARAKFWGAGSGALAGAALGSVIPGIGTAIGAGIGTIVGALGGYFGSDLLASAMQSRDSVEQNQRRDALKGYAIGGLITNEQYALVGEGGNSEVILPLSDYSRSITLMKDASNRKDIDPRLSTVFKNNISKYANGGIVTTEELAIVGENNKPEIVIPLTNSDKAREIMSQASTMNGVDSDVSDMMSKATEEEPKINTPQRTVADLIISNAKSVIGAPYTPNSRYDTNPQRGMVCNQLVEYAYHKAGIPLKSRSVHYHIQSGDWILTNTPQPGFAIFSNYGYKDKYGLSDWGHLGIVGYGNERIHASSAQGRVVHDNDLTKTLSYEKNPKKYAKSYIFGYLKGVDYGNDTDLPDPTQIETSIADTPSSYTSFQQLSPISPVSDMNTESNIINVPNPFVVSKRDLDLTEYNSFLHKYTPEAEILNNEVIGDILLAKKKDTSDSFFDLLSSKNPLGVKSIDGTIEEYSSLQEGVDAFISKMERQYEQLQNMDYMQQLEYLRMKSEITDQDFSRTKNVYDERLYQAIDRLRQSIDQSNMYSKNASLRNLPTQPHADRRFV